MCNRWCNEFVQRALVHFPSRYTVLEVGARNVNGSPRDVIPGGHKGPHEHTLAGAVAQGAVAQGAVAQGAVAQGAVVYVGVDIEAGPGVDVICNVEDLDQAGLFKLPVPDAQGDTFDLHFDVVVSTEMLEHVADWRLALIQMANRVAPGGLLILTTRSPGFEYHPYPLDKWRFTTEDMQRIFDPQWWDVLMQETDPDLRNGRYSGVGIVARRKQGGVMDLLKWGKHLDTLNVMEVHG